jgi:DNA-binding transcriptional LysR family regulator
MTVIPKMNNKKLDLNLLLIMHTLLETRHVTRAAEQLFMSQPTVSRALQKLRNSFNDPLLIKAQQGYDLSARAQELLPQLSQLLVNIDTMITEPTFNPQTSSKKINILAMDPEVISFLPKLFTSLRQQAPSMMLNVSSHPCDIFEQLAQDKAHFTISPLSPDTAEEQFYRLPLTQTSFVCLMHKKHWLAKDEITLEKYLQACHGLISITGKGIGFTDKRLAKIGKKRNVVLQLYNFSSVAQFCESSDIVFILPEFYAKELLIGRDLVIKPPPSEISLEMETFYLYWHQRYHLDPMCIWLRNTLLDTQNILSEPLK